MTQYGQNDAVWAWRPKMSPWAWPRPKIVKMTRLAFSIKIRKFGKIRPKGSSAENGQNDVKNDAILRKNSIVKNEAIVEQVVEWIATGSRP